VLFGTFLRFAPKNSRNKRFSDVFAQRINVVRTTTKTVFVSYLFLEDGIPGLPKTTSNQEAVFESPQTQIHYPVRYSHKIRVMDLASFFDAM